MTSLPQQLTVTNSELPGSQLPSAVRRRELLATRNLMTSWSPTLRPCGSLTMLPTTVMDVSNIADSSHSSDCDARRTAIDRCGSDSAARRIPCSRGNPVDEVSTVDRRPLGCSA